MRFHGRMETGGHATIPAATEWRIPRASAGGRRSGFDGPGDWRWLCLDHVRAFNSGYNFFSGMSQDEIQTRHNPYGGWDRETRAFSTNGSPPPRWAISPTRSTRSAPASSASRPSSAPTAATSRQATARR
jgi:hypothetical protein